MEGAQAQYSAADPEAIVVVGPVQRVSRLSALVRKAAAAAGHIDERAVVLEILTG